LVGLVLAGLVAPIGGEAAVKTWAWTSGDSNWMNSVNWSGGTVPVNYDDVVINNAKVELTNDTAILNSLTLTNKAYLYVYSPATNGATQWGLLVSVSGQVTIVSNSWIYPYSHGTNGGSAWFMCSNLAVDANSGFDANSKGYAGGTNTANSQPGYGPGGTAGILSGSGGAGYGGIGGPGSDAGGNVLTGTGGATYGNYTDPVDPGSGGGRSYTGSSYDPGVGGGLIRVLATDSVIVERSVVTRCPSPPASSISTIGAKVCPATMSPIGCWKLPGRVSPAMRRSSI